MTVFCFNLYSFRLKGQKYTFYMDILPYLMFFGANLMFIKTFCTSYRSVLALLRHNEQDFCGLFPHFFRGRGVSSRRICRQSTPLALRAKEAPFRDVAREGFATQSHRAKGRHQYGVSTQVHGADSPLRASSRHLNSRDKCKVCRQSTQYHRHRLGRYQYREA